MPFNLLCHVFIVFERSFSIKWARMHQKVLPVAVLFQAGTRRARHCDHQLLRHQHGSAGGGDGAVGGGGVKSHNSILSVRKK